jgi:hypothetical protein
MQKTLTINSKRFTAKTITKLPKEITNGGSYITVINGEKFFWDYRQIQDCYFAPVCNKNEANAIALMRDNGSYHYSVWMQL